MPYDTKQYRGNWSAPLGPHSDPELYDYNNDPDETVNQATHTHSFTHPLTYNSIFHSDPLTQLYLLSPFQHNYIRSIT